MSSVATLVMMAALASAPAGPMPDGRVIGEAPASAETAPEDPRCAHPADASAIVVCGQRAGPSQRLPLREDRFADGEIVRLHNEPASATGALAADHSTCHQNCEPSRLGETLGKGLRLLKALATGEDPTS